MVNDKDAVVLQPALSDMAARQLSRARRRRALVLSSTGTI
jgi:hypothetical protein